ncbi:hypothetical protein D3P07_01050 [Paenibacillus sp. 1011MAR3C5]|uniref:hypothetical protein n=1 Tax=Paenibacillus sp. 1011MAR3C5 TaxID=1675787 RepID=UPI000E6C1466|nr:hypothetical protein [Paenibacillus sp. 1011MAR3C5]RJE90723.1 hypothetical protein D3P07_01050 [Paenibacillus sp. 1011MAR3C5]
MIKELVHEDAFRKYLGKVLSSERLIRDCISRSRRVELHEGNLLKHYNVDCGSSLLDRLSYSKDDANRGIEPAHGISFKGSKGYISIYEGTVSLKQAVVHYFDFLKQQG